MPSGGNALGVWDSGSAARENGKRTDKCLNRKFITSGVGIGLTSEWRAPDARQKYSSGARLGFGWLSASFISSFRTNINIFQ